MKKIIRLNESDLGRIVKRVLREQNDAESKCFYQVFGFDLKAMDPKCIADYRGEKKMTFGCIYELVNLSKNGVTLSNLQKKQEEFEACRASKDTLSK